MMQNQNQAAPTTHLQEAGLEEKCQNLTISNSIKGILSMYFDQKT
jgi:hypothetical protein